MEAEQPAVRKAGPRSWWQRATASRPRRLLLLGGALVVLLVAGAGVYVLALRARLDRLDVTPPGSRTGGTTYLVVGTDSRQQLDDRQRQYLGTTPGARADIVLLIRIPSDGGPPQLLSIPRDLLVLGPDFGLHRLALTWLDGPQVTVDALCTSLGVGVDHVVSIDLAGFAELVDAVGGVDVEIPRPIRDTVIGFTLEPGRHHLDGVAALQYVRARHLEELGPFAWSPLPNQRAEQARVVLREVASKAQTSLNPVHMHRFLWAATDAVAVDSGTGILDLRDLARAAREIDPNADVELLATATDGPIPYSELDENAAAMLDEVGAGSTSCPSAAFPQARLNAGK